MLIKFFKKPLFHVLLWGFMVLYFLVAPDIYTALFTSHGKPLKPQNVAYTESNRISWVVEELARTDVDGQRLFNLYGWAFIGSNEDGTAGEYTREIVLLSEERRYFFPVQPVYRSPSPHSLFSELNVDLNHLGFSALIEEDLIKPGKYRVGIVFKDNSNGSAFYWDKPAYYLVRTPNTLRLEEK